MRGLSPSVCPYITTGSQPRRVPSSAQRRTKCQGLAFPGPGSRSAARGRSILSNPHAFEEFERAGTAAKELAPLLLKSSEKQGSTTGQVGCSTSARPRRWLLMTEEPSNRTWASVAMACGRLRMPR